MGGGSILPRVSHLCVLRVCKPTAIYIQIVALWSLSFPCGGRCRGRWHACNTETLLSWDDLWHSSIVQSGDNGGLETREDAFSMHNLVEIGWQSNSAVLQLQYRRSNHKNEMMKELNCTWSGLPCVVWVYKPGAKWELDSALLSWSVA